jgi:hypothetical protein
MTDTPLKLRSDSDSSEHVRLAYRFIRGQGAVYDRMTLIARALLHFLGSPFHRGISNRLASERGPLSATLLAP